MSRKTSLAGKGAILLTAAMLTGCAFVPDTVHPAYAPNTTDTKIASASNIRVYVLAQNRKKHKNEISVEKDGYDIPMAGVYMHVAKDFKAALETALADRGFTISKDHGDEMVVVINHFFSHETNGFSGITQNGDSSVLVKIIKDGRTYLTKRFSVRNLKLKTGVINFSTLAYRSRIAKALLNKTVNQIVSDQQVIDALFQAAGKTPPANLGVTVPASVSPN